MKRVFMLFVVVAIVWLVLYGVLIISHYVALKYEIESIADDAIVGRVYDITNTSTVLNVVWFVFSVVMMVLAWVKSRR